MQRMTIYLDDALRDAIVTHAELKGQKLSTFIARELAHLLDQPVDSAAPLRREADAALREAKRAL